PNPTAERTIALPERTNDAVVRTSRLFVRTGDAVVRTQRGELGKFPVLPASRDRFSWPGPGRPACWAAGGWLNARSRPRPRSWVLPAGVDADRVGGPRNRGFCLFVAPWPPRPRKKIDRLLTVV